MIDVVLLTDTPARVRQFLLDRNIAKIDNGNIVGVKGGFEGTLLGVPNPIVTTPASGTPGQPGYTPPVMDPRKVYLIRLSGESDADDDDGTPGEGDRFLRSKLRAWVIANSTAVILNSADGATYRTRKITGANAWLVMPADAARFGSWQ